MGILRFVLSRACGATRGGAQGRAGMRRAHQGVDNQTGAHRVSTRTQHERGGPRLRKSARAAPPSLYLQSEHSGCLVPEGFGAPTSVWPANSTKRESRNGDGR